MLTQNEKKMYLHKIFTEPGFWPLFLTKPGTHVLFCWFIYARCTDGVISLILTTSSKGKEDIIILLPCLETSYKSKNSVLCFLRWAYSSEMKWLNEHIWHQNHVNTCKTVVLCFLPFFCKVWKHCIFFVILISLSSFHFQPMNAD